MYKFLPFLLLLFWFSGVKATHIVGGELEFKNLGNDRYRLKMNLYYDAIGAAVQAPNEVYVNIFRKSDDGFMEKFKLPKKSESLVPYSNPDCISGFLITKKLVYWDEFTLNSDTYSHYLGYYMTFESCCRNAAITNIEDAVNTGQIFYLEFPPLKLNGGLIVNSTPEFASIADYICLNTPYYIDYSGTDTDGDSLVYSMVTPMEISASSTPASAPYDSVIWLPGFGVHEQITGPEPLHINAQTGELRVIPDQLGLFVFGVRCQEFRNGVKIGEVRRDFQILVVDCPTNVSPEISATTGILNEPYIEGTVLQLNSKKEHCLTLISKDPNPNEVLTITGHPVNFAASPELAVQVTSPVNNGTDTDSLSVQICFPRCLPPAETPYLIDYIVKDNACPLRNSDTIRIAFNYPDENKPPVFTFLQNGVLVPGNEIEAEIGQELVVTVIGTDINNDTLYLEASGANFILADQGINFASVTDTGRVESALTWLPDCYLNSPGVYEIRFSLKEKNCFPENADTTLFIKVKMPLQNKDFTPANIFTPNNDGVNDVFEFSNIPIDLCGDSFVQISIYNRWGAKIYSSPSRLFAWDGKDAPEGIYYYNFEYENKSYKGIVTLVR